MESFSRTPRSVRSVDANSPFFLLACPQRQRLFEMAGAGQTPYLIDPNTGARGYESSEIVDYLEKTYAL